MEVGHDEKLVSGKSSKPLVHESDFYLARCVRDSFLSSLISSLRRGGASQVSRVPVVVPSLRDS